MTALLKDATSGWISPEEYLQSEEGSPVRREYLAGRVYAMSGASEAHNLIAGAIFAELYLHLRGKPCAPFINDMKARIGELAGSEWYYYPDVMVNCDPRGQQKYFCETPSVIVEVLSDSTERIDTREKYLAYQAIATLHTYVLVSQTERKVTILRRGGTQAWESYEVLSGPGAELRIPELNFAISLDTVYERTGL